MARKKDRFNKRDQKRYSYWMRVGLPWQMAEKLTKTGLSIHSPEAKAITRKVRSDWRDIKETEGNKYILGRKLKSDWSDFAYDKKGTFQPFKLIDEYYKDPEVSQRHTEKSVPFSIRKGDRNREKRYINLRKDGFTDFEAREYSQQPEKFDPKRAPYFASWRKQRAKRKADYKRLGYSDREYEQSIIKDEYIYRGLTKPHTKNEPDPWKRYREAKDAYKKNIDREYKSPGRKNSSSAYIREVL